MTDSSKQEAPSALFRHWGGDGVPHVLGLHGFGGAAEAFRAFARDLSRTSFWTGDLWGHRGRAWPERVLDFDSALLALTEQLELVPSPRYLVGYSMGGRMGLAVWARNPSLFVGATLIGVHPGLSSTEERDARRALDLERAERLRRIGVAKFFAEWDRSPLFQGRPAEAQPWRESHDLGLARAFEVFGLSEQPDLSAALAERVDEGRALLVVGDQDEKFRRLLAPWRPRTLPGSHDLLATCPGPLARAVLEHRSSVATRER